MNREEILDMVEQMTEEETLIYLKDKTPEEIGDIMAGLLERYDASQAKNKLAREQAAVAANAGPYHLFVWMDERWKNVITGTYMACETVLLGYPGAEHRIISAAAYDAGARPSF